jgi:hypothetical protein
MRNRRFVTAVSCLAIVGVILLSLALFSLRPADANTTGPRPGRWEAQGNFEGSFRVTSDRAWVTDLEGRFWTPTCGYLEVPGDIIPTEDQFAISENKIHIVLDTATLTYLVISGTFNTETSIEGEYDWSVDGCATGLTPVDWSGSWQGTSTYLPFVVKNR